MRGWLGTCVAWSLLLLVSASGWGAVERVTASDFRSNGDLIDGWYWLRDQRFQQYAEWRFEAVPPGTGDLTIEITALATDPVDGSPGGEARFRLVYGLSGSGETTGIYEFQVVSLRRASSADDPGGRVCRGEVTLPQAGLPGTSTIVFRIERESPEDNHIAFSAGSLILIVADDENAPPALRIAPADGFASTGDLIDGTVWCRRGGQVLEWTWSPREGSGGITDAAVNLRVLVTTVAEGASGLSDVADVTVLDPEGRVAEVGTIHLVNTFRPLYTGDSGGVGWVATGAYKLKDLGLIEDGFTLRMGLSGGAPPESPAQTAGLVRKFGGERSSATLAYVVDPPPGQTAGAAIETTIYDILNDPRSYDGQRVRIEARFYGANGELCPCSPQSPSDWLIGAQQFYMYVSNGALGALPAWEALSFERPILVTGTVGTAVQSESLVCPYLKLEAVEIREE